MKKQAAIRILSVLALLCVTGAAMGQSSFHFTVTADPRSNHSGFGNTLNAINNLVGGPGAFHVSPGDIDGRVWENRAQIDTYFGTSALWYPGIGNHESEDAVEMAWIRDEYNIGNGGRAALKLSTNQDGPLSSKETTYSWDHGNAHFIQLNEYWNGSSDVGTNGDVGTPLYNWLAADLAANTRPAVFVFGHEPAFPYNRHVGDSLDSRPANRDRFWALLEQYDVDALFVGHTHTYSTHQGDKNHVGDVWQIDAGNAGNGSPYTFIDVAVTDTEVTFSMYNNSGGWSQKETWTEPVPEPATMSLLGLGALALIRRRRRKA